ncbi:MAG TPA: LysR family transcriptional regulator, partial [Burkholderiales bacterium]|nr:LysR family transcriptional regulator [Burkholderiales bacterium]
MENLAGMAVFARVAEAKSFTEAARRLGLSKSVVSKLVARLEASLGARLMHRTTRRLSLTEAGAALYEHCARMLAEAEAAELAVSSLRAMPRGVLRVSSPAAFGHLHIAPAIPEFLRRYPEATVEMVMNDRIVDLAEEGYDVAIRLTEEPGPNMVARALAPIRWAVCATAAYLKDHPAPEVPADLAQHNCLYYSQQGSPGEWRFDGPGGAKSVRVSGNFRVNNSEAVREAALGHLGIALLPTFAVGPDFQSGRLRRVLPDYTPLGVYGGQVYAAYLSGRHLSPKVRAFVDFFVERFSPQPYWDRDLAAPGERKRQAT